MIIQLAWSNHNLVYYFGERGDLGNREWGIGNGE
jgi:hypothetical protein